MGIKPYLSNKKYIELNGDQTKYYKTDSLDLNNTDR